MTLSQKRLKNIPNFVPADIADKYQKSDLDYKYCVVKFSEMQSAKRDSIPIPTMKLWYIEFIKRDWNKYKFDTQFEALMETDILGYSIRIDHWLNAVKDKTNYKAYEPYKSLPEQREESGKGLLGLREYIDELDKKLGLEKKKKYYIDRKTKEKIYYPELPSNYKAKLISEWRRSERIKKENRGN